jgi:4,5-DOPA dioxygenase extradiol
MTAEKMPALFVGHGNPMNAIEHNRYTAGWAGIGALIPRPKAVLAISAHWFVPGTSVTAVEEPRTIHDFGGFPRELYEVRYPARGDPALASEVQALLSPLVVGRDRSWGLDHGTWSVLIHVFPEADIPVVQLSIDETKPPSFHYEVGRWLAPLRNQSVLLMGSGNLVHNLHTYAWGRHPVEPFDWAVRFESIAREMIASREHPSLIDYESLGRDALLSVPTPEHYLPLLYILATQAADERATFPLEGVDGGSISMLTVQIG